MMNCPLPGPPVGPVDAVVGDALQHDDVFHLDRAAEELEAVVLVVLDHHVVDLGAIAADALEGDAVELVVGAELGAGELDAQVRTAGARCRPFGVAAAV